MNKGEGFNTIRPRDRLLSEHIAYYYFHETYSEDFERTFTYYPNYRVALNVFKNSQIKWDGKKRYTLPSDQAQLNSIVTFTTKTSREVVMKGKINKIGVIFKPLGLNHFINQPISDLLTGTISHFENFNFNEREQLEGVFQKKDFIKKRDVLDQLFRDRYVGFDEKVMVTAVKDVLSKGGEISVQELADDLEISRKTLLRLFNKHICCSVKGFAQLIKFRNALNTYKNQTGDISLTELAYQNQYYDQSSFIKHVNAVTGINPSKLFLELNDFADENTIWTLKD